jgi:putative endonuclease
LTAPVTRPGTGRRGEDAALRWLLEQGLHLRERNFRCRRGEIDLVMQDRDCIVFVEVRYRSDWRYGTPAETVDARKRRRLLIAAQYYLQSHPDACGAPARFDVIALGPGDPEPCIEWISNAFDG